MSTEEKSPELTEYQKARIEKNKKRALQLRSQRIAVHPYQDKASAIRIPRSIDTGGGFLVEDEEALEHVSASDLVEEPAPILDGPKDTCIDCNKKFSESRLYKHFEISVCDTCKENGKHPLITRTESKNKYCLKDCDLDLREPILKFIVRKNPHDDRWGDMKLYYEKLVLRRALEVWGSEEKIEEERDRRLENKDKKKVKQYQKQVKAMRQAVRTSTWHKDLTKHTHEYDSENETYDEEEDTYTKKCKSCQHTVTYEKM